MISAIDIKTIAVIGAGTMGQGIAQAFATAGYPTKLFDVDEKLIHNGIALIAKNLSVAVEKGRITETQRQLISNKIVAVNALTQVKADLIIEAVIEKLDVKQHLFFELEKINTPKTIFVTNTSSLSVARIVAKLKRPEQCIGLHFFNPAHLMKLVEVVAGPATDPRLVILLMDLAKKIGKTPVSVKDSPGFIVNRVARHYYVESLKALEENVASVSGIDKLLRSAGFKMGPFELMDLIGVDINYSVTASLHEAFYPDPKFMPNKLQQQKIEAGHLGRKSGKGFYDYEKN